MSDFHITLILVGAVSLMALFGILTMKSPEKGRSPLQGLLLDIQKMFEPGAKNVAEARKEIKREARKDEE